MVGILSSRKPSLCGPSESKGEDRKRKAEIGKERRAGGQEEKAGGESQEGAVGAIQDGKPG